MSLSGGRFVFGSVTANIEYAVYSKLRTDDDRIFEFKIFSRTLYSNLRLFLVIYIEYSGSLSFSEKA